MKKSVVGLLLIAILFQTCREDDPVKPGKIQFTIDPSALSNGGGRKMTELPDDAIMLLTVENQHGVVFSMKEFSVLKVGNQYVSEPVALTPGHYNLTSFVVTTASNVPLFATPVNGSPLARSIDRPIPIAFSVAENAVTNTSVEIISTAHQRSEDFGYDPFPVSYDETQSFDLSTYIENDNHDLVLTDVQAYLLLEDDTIYRAILPASVNTISFEPLPDEFYTLVLIKDAQKKFTRTFRINDLQEELNGNPLTVTLDPAFTIVTSPFFIEDQYRFAFRLANNNPTLEGTVTIDWGDGTLEEIDLAFDCCRERDHVYPAGGERFISVSGNLDIIESLSIEYDNPIRAISVKHLTELKDVSIVATNTPATIDITHNTKLETAAFGMTWITSLDVSKNTHLKNLFLVYMTNFSSASMNQIIADMYQHASERNTMAGWITLVDVNGGPIGPLTPESIQKLHQLQDVYGWTIEPSLELFEN